MKLQRFLFSHRNDDQDGIAAWGNVVFTGWLGHAGHDHGIHPGGARHAAERAGPGVDGQPGDVAGRVEALAVILPIVFARPAADVPGRGLGILRVEGCAERLADPGFVHDAGRNDCWRFRAGDEVARRDAAGLESRAAGDRAQRLSRGDADRLLVAG